GEKDRLGTAISRPFILPHVNFARDHNGARSKLPRIFPPVDAENMGIIIPAKGSPSPFAVVMINRVPDLGIWGISGSHCFPRWVYPEQTSQDSDASLFEDVGAGSRQHNVTDATLASFQNLVTGELSKDDIFFYVYGLLHSPDYQQAFKVDLRKEDCRIENDGLIWPHFGGVATV
ncbi:MAG: hypothetical protein H8E59_00015, partial [Actinobacteria bacterium]|nr:hypothetical protein [Actinomycetota bacterium]